MRGTVHHRAGPGQLFAFSGDAQSHQKIDLKMSLDLAVDRQPVLRKRAGNLPLPRKALRTSIKSHFWKISSTFGNKYPQNGSKNGQTAPRTGMGCPFEGPSVASSENPLDLRLWLQGQLTRLSNA